MRTDWEAEFGYRHVKAASREPYICFPSVSSEVFPLLSISQLTQDQLPLLKLTLCTAGW